jgi:AcrR family transcriptional regulator
VRADPEAGAPGPRTRKGEQTRARLIEAAKGVFEDHGFRDARISDISKRAGLSHGSFYHYFESKEEVFLEVVDTLQDRVSNHAVVGSGLLDSSLELTLRERLEFSNRAFLEDYRSEAKIMGVIEQVARYDPAVAAIRVDRMMAYTARAAKGIRHLQSLGLADEGLVPEVAAAALTAMVARFAEMWLVQGAITCTLDEAVDVLTTMCANVLRLREPAER